MKVNVQIKVFEISLLFSHFPQSTIKKGFHSVSCLPSVTESDENISDTNVDMNQNGIHSNEEDSSQVTIFLFVCFFNLIFQRLVKGKIEYT